MIGTPRGDAMTSPRRRVTRKAGPITDCAAVAPSKTMSRGLTAATSPSSQGLHAHGPGPKWA